ncbi:MAG: DUF4157 domain-containing protein [Thermoanaerobaculia bacterium]
MPKASLAAAPVRHILHSPRPQAKLTVGAPDDAFEREADQVADQVMRMPEPGVQRMCADCEEELQAKEEPGQTPEVPNGFEPRFAALQSGGRPLPAADRAFFEPRFGRDFSGVRLHSGPAAGELARSVHARAFTLGDSIVLGSGEGGESGRQLLAHELTHVVQQGGGEEARTIRRQTIHASCAGRGDDLIRAAWAEGQRMARETAESLDGILQIMSYGRDPATITPRRVQLIRSTFGDLGFVPGGMTFLSDLIRRYRRIEAGFTEGRTLRCDASSATDEGNECEQFDAFVIRGNRTDVFLCPTFFNPERTATGRGVTLVHEMAHSVLGIDHQGGLFQTFGCNFDLGLEYDDAKRNAYAYHILANCLHGEGASEGERYTAPPSTTAPRPLDPRWSISASAGTELRPAAERFAGVLGGRYSLRSGQLVVFNPVIGLNALYLPSGARPEHLAAATVDLGLRIQQPLRGVYFDVTGGGLAGFTVDAAGGTRPTAGLTGSASIGYRWERIELGAEARGLLPLTSGDSGSVLVLGRLAFRLGSSR